MQKRIVGSTLMMVLSALLGCAPAPAQTGAQAAPNAVYVELFGNGLFYSLNYDRRIADRATARVGVMVLAGSGGREGLVMMPLMVNYLLGLGAHHLEAGLGVTPAFGRLEEVEDATDEAFSGIVATAALGYRYQRPTGGVMARVGFTPFVGSAGAFGWFGASVGYAF